jgi:hypothetical protein
MKSINIEQISDFAITIPDSIGLHKWGVILLTIIKVLHKMHTARRAFIYCCYRS